MNKDLTILLLLKDQAPFTWRWMNYYNQIGLPFKVLIADGGKDKSVEKLADKSLFPNVNYEYIRYPFDKDINIFFKKVYDALTQVRTKYVVLASNDDFYLPKVLKAAVNFLDKNQDYVVSRGDIYDFQVKGTTGQNEPEEVYGKMKNVVKLYTNESNMASTALERTRIISEYPNSLWHDVCHTNKLKEGYQILIDSEILDLDLSDRLINYFLATRGKIHRGGGLYMLHQSQQAGLAHVLGRRNTFDWMLSENWPKDVSKIFNIVAKKISEKDGVEIEYARNKIMQYYLCFIIGKKMIKERMERSIATGPTRIVRWGRILPQNNKIRLVLKSLYIHFTEFVRERKNQKIVDQSPYREDIRMISDFLINNTHK